MADTPMDAHTVALEALRRDTTERFEALWREVRDTKEQFEALRREVRDTNERFNGLRVLIESVHADVRLTLEHLAPALPRTNQHDGRLDAHDGRIDALDARVTGLESRTSS